MASPSTLDVPAPGQGQGQDSTFSPSQTELPLDLLSFIGGLDHSALGAEEQGLSLPETETHGHEGMALHADGADDLFDTLDYTHSRAPPHEQSARPFIQTAVGMEVSMSDAGPSSAGPSQPTYPPPIHSQANSQQSASQEYRSPSSATSHNRRESTEIGRQTSARGRTRAKSRKSQASASARQAQESGMMELDQGHQGMQMEPDMQNQQYQHAGLMEGFEGEFDPNMLQQQLESIHMQSPLVWASNNGWADPVQAVFNSQGQLNSREGEMGMMMPPGQGQKWNMHGGLITPGPSGSMFPQMRTDKMSPMHLEMLAKARAVYGDVNSLPLLSPALSHEANSAYTSPAHQVAFNDPAQAQSLYGSAQPSPAQGQGQGQGQAQAQADRSPLEQLQEQQRHFQEQLLVLQDQQAQLQASAAAAVASGSATSSPYVSTSGNSGRPATTPGMGAGPHGAYFSPLTSPALEASASASASAAGRLAHFGHAGPSHHYSPSLMGSGRGHSHPHPLSALSSPALNPVGSAGGGQQTLSPALGPHMGQDAEPDYLAALSGYMDAQHAAGAGPSGPLPQLGPPYMGSSHSHSSHSAHPSPVLHTSHPSSASISTQNSATSQSQSQHGLVMSPLTGQGPFSSHGSTPTSAGPHRTLNRQSRPSPMMKPTVRNGPGAGHSRQANGGSAGGQFSMPSSPVTALGGRTGFTPGMLPGVPMPGGIPGVGHLPPAAIDQRGVLQAQAALQAANASTPSTPSPVDLSHIMPPPPVPNYSHAGKGGGGVVPMTPASLMNLGGGNADPLPRPNAAGASRPQRKPAVAPSPAASTAASAGPKRSKLAPAPQNKRGVPSRPAAIVAARSSKAAAAAAALQTEGGETRKTSHKAAEQKRRDSLKAGFDELRLLLPPINTEALDPESGEPIPGSSAPRLLPKSSLVPDDNPNRGVSKVALLKFSNEYVGKLVERVKKRDEYIDRLREEVRRLRVGAADGGEADRDLALDLGLEDLLEEDMRQGEDDFDAPPLPLGAEDGSADADGSREGASSGRDRDMDEGAEEGDGDAEADDDAEDGDGDEAMDDDLEAAGRSAGIGIGNGSGSGSAADRSHGANGTANGGTGADKWGLTRRRSGGIGRAVRRSVAAA